LKSGIIGVDVEGDAETLGNGAKFVVVADDGGDIDLQFAGGVARKEVVEAVGLVGYEDGELRPDVGEVE